MGRPKGGKNKEWSKERKYEIILPIINGEKSSYEIEREIGISRGMIRNWVRKFNDGGIEALQNKRKPGNPLVKYSRRKELTELEQLEYENMLLRIENLRLKKGYTQEDVLIAHKKLSEKNTK
ncbi:MAG TPA: hypothetical protein DCR62_02260 [Acholeplasmatales bacterium]|nr:hypothetical protein [Acholeplasmatales bacterium]